MIPYESSSTDNPPQITHICTITHVEQQSKSSFHHRKVRTKDIQAIANDIFERKGRGITFKDLIKGKYKRVDTAKQGQNVLYYNKKRGVLYTNSIRTRPRQYYLSKGDADEAATNYKRNTGFSNHIDKRSTHIHPTGVNTSATDFNTKITILEMAIEDKKADSLAEAIEIISNDTDGELPVGLHNIRISLSLPPHFTTQAYNERLSHIPESGTKERSKKISTIIDSYKVDVFFYPNKDRKTVIIIPCSERPFPIGLNSPDRVTSDFTSFVAQVRRFICSHLSDYRGKIVPPIHNPRHWRLIHADLNWDIPTTMLNYLGMDGLQITKVNDVILRIYRKRIAGKRFIRLEEGVHPFPVDMPIDNSIGQRLVEAAKSAQEELSSSMGK